MLMLALTNDSEEITTSVKEQEAIAIMVFLQEWDNAHKVAQTTVTSSTASLKQGRTRAAAEVPREPDCFWLTNSVAQAASVSLDSWRCCAVVRWRGWARSLLKICLKNKLLQRQRHPHPPHSAGLKNTLVRHGMLAEEDGLQGKLHFWPCSPYTCSHRYLTEFLEIRGVLIPLEILRLNHLKEGKRGFIKLLLLTGGTGREYKELICESCGTQHVHLCFVLIQARMFSLTSSPWGCLLH
ncbi:LOW QUALITY PROTEIN: armadillo-like helical domain containing protein 1 [Geothlypis trichas]